MFSLTFAAPLKGVHTSSSQSLAPGAAAAITPGTWEGGVVNPHPGSHRNLWGGSWEQARRVIQMHAQAGGGLIDEVLSPPGNLTATPTNGSACGDRRGAGGVGLGAVSVKRCVSLPPLFFQIGSEDAMAYNRVAAGF